MSFVPGEIVDSSGNRVKVDQYSNSLYTIDVAHGLIHQGKTFAHSGKVSIGAASNYDHLVVMQSTTRAHFHTFQVVSDTAPMDIFIYETPTTTSNGTLQTSYNKNRMSATAAQLALYHTPTVTAVGTQIDYYQLVGTKQSGGVGVAIFDEWVLNPLTTYLVRITNPNAGAAVCEYRMGWYELQ